MAKKLTNAEFLRTVFRYMPPHKQRIRVCFFSDLPKPGEKGWFGHPFDPLNRLLKLERPQDNAYFAVSSFTAGSDGHYRRIKANFAALHCIVIDDVGIKIKYSAIKLKPSWSLETSPGNYQYGYLLRQPITDRALAERLINALIQAIGTDGLDPGMSGVTRYVRLPVGSNTKEQYVKKLGSPWRHRLRQWHPRRRYGWVRIAWAFKLKLGPPRALPARTGHSAESLVPLLTSLGLVLGTNASNPAAIDIVCPWIATHTDRAESGSAYFPPSVENPSGGYKCHHGHCAQRTLKDLKSWLRSEGLRRLYASKPNADCENK